MNVRLTGDALKYIGYMAGDYFMEPGLSNGQRYWISPGGNGIWMRHIGNQWKIGNSHFNVSIEDSSEVCPHDNLKSNWKYEAKYETFVEDVFNSVRINCLKGT